MTWRDKVKASGKPTKRFRVWRADARGKPHVFEGDYDTVERLRAHRWKSDSNYKIQVGRKFLTRRQLEDYDAQAPTIRKRFTDLKTKPPSD
jgi:hypothetical protein